MPNEPVSWRIRRWAAPAALALLVAAAITTVGLTGGGETPSMSHWAFRTPRFLISAGSSTAGANARAPWFQVRTSPTGGEPGHVVDAPQPPAATGAVQEIVDGADGTFLVAASRGDPCETRLYRFRLTHDGHVAGLAPLRGGIAPMLIAGLAMSPDGTRIAYTSAPCADRPQHPPTPASPARITLTVLDIASGHRRTWSASGPGVIGEIAWARDGRTLGYTTAEVPSGVARDAALRNVTVHALDTRVGGSDLRAGRVLFHSPGGAGTVSSATMGPDGHSGYGVMHRPSATIVFSFAEGAPMHVTSTIPDEPNTATGIGFVDEEARHACLTGLDSFGRAVGGAFRTDYTGSGRCDTAWVY